jgi:hypothetical protein
MNPSSIRPDAASDEIWKGSGIRHLSADYTDFHRLLRSNEF